MGAGPLRVLLVDDDVVDAMNVKRAFDKARLSELLHVAQDGIEALEALRAAAGSRWLVLLDLNLPRMTGLELLRELRADPALRETPVVVLTTSNDARDRADTAALRVSGYLVKPVGHAALIGLLGPLLSRS